MTQRNPSWRLIEEAESEEKASYERFSVHQLSLDAPPLTVGSIDKKNMEKIALVLKKGRVSLLLYEDCRIYVHTYADGR